MSVVDNLEATLVHSCKINSESYLSGSEVVDGGEAQMIDVTLDTIAAHTIVASFDHAKVQAVYLLADKDCTSVVFTGTTGPVEVPLTAGVPFSWSRACNINGATPEDDAFKANCTSLVVTTAALNTTIKGRIVQAS